MTATKTPGGAVDAGEHCFVQDAGAKNPVSAGLQYFMLRSRWKEYQETRLLKCVGNYLEVL
jgi:hypothetical protein